MIKYSDESKIAYAKLYSAYNDIDIFVEDELLIGIYEKLFEKISPPNTKLTSITALSGRKHVLEAAKSLQDDVSRKRFFLIDGDLNWLLGEDIKIKNLYAMQCYSIENFCWDKEAIIFSAHCFTPRKRRSEISGYFNSGILDDIENIIKPLFILYAVAFSLGSSTPTASCNVNRYFDESEFFPCRRKILSRVREMYTILFDEFGSKKVLSERKRIYQSLMKRKIYDHRIISGKTYLMRIIQKIIEKKYNYRGNQNQLLSIIIEKSELSVDLNIKTAFLSALTD